MALLRSLTKSEKRRYWTLGQYTTDKPRWTYDGVGKTARCISARLKRQEESIRALIVMLVRAILPAHQPVAFSSISCHSGALLSRVAIRVA